MDAPTPEQNEQNEPTASSPPERRDEGGLPLDREPTIDDVRGGANHGLYAMGCAAVVVILVAAFWILRAYVLR
jgi:hypothetical protein